MKKTIIDISGNRAFAFPADAAISFRPFMAHLEKRASEEQGLKGNFYRTVLERFHEKPNVEADIDLEHIYQYEDLLEYLYAILSPTLAAESELAWGLAFPLQPVLFYGTASIYEMLTHNLQAPDDYTIAKTPQEYHRDRLKLVYSLILQRLYNFQPPVKTGQYHAWSKGGEGLLRYYYTAVNMDFLEVTVKGELPSLDTRELLALLSGPDGFAALEKMLPLEQFRFRGIAIVTATDVTAQQAVENIRKIRLMARPGEERKGYEDVIRSLKTLVQNDRIEFDLFPFVRVNNRAVYGYEKSGTGVLFSVWGEDNFTPEEFAKNAEAYSARPDSFYSPDVSDEGLKKMSFVQMFRKLGVRSLALTPVFHQGNAVGVLGMHTWGDDQFDEKTLALLEPVIAPIGQLLQIYIDEFNLELENIIKEKFTSIQPAVQWKFNEVAWHILHHKKKNLSVETEPIRFEQVYPLYGAIDIRNSTMERNKAAMADLDAHLLLLTTTLAALQPHHQSVILDEMIFHSRKWQQVLDQGPLPTTDEANLNHFLNEETAAYLRHISQQAPTTRDGIAAYLDIVKKPDGQAQRNRHSLETSMQKLNTAINQYFELEKDKLQQSYPCYFEKFRTDGIEYDIYIGQSIAPKQPFDHFHLKHLRLWQLSSMAAIARLTRSLLPEMPVALETTQLIFVHNHPIDISFRTDERKFDVEGAYNIRYQMIKKRIDKVHIRHTGERLTQPGKIALIYFNKRDVEDYLPYIGYLQETGVIEPGTEELELEDLQGLSGLRALRIGIRYE
ncbi:GAF domain-containing protein [Chitinophaga barathri]|uniref:GAF domain-containing protein n=1 Tax=Chitinophaga barathri TaxID=1647451 RepID=A0A3N4MG10_9BACT|nr:GAF domain-containing protein [Chitinophaga barathri]RPD42781.1 GAF domain-containing protein [Chitinophaga barathri]